jgi:hypothetical protein
MQAGRSFKELQEAYRNGERAFPVDAGQTSLPVSSGSSNPTFTVDVQPPTHAQRTGSVPQFNHANIASDQVRRSECARYGAPRSWFGWAWPIRSPTVLVFFESPSMLGYSVHLRKPAELLNSESLELTTDATPMRTKSFLLFLSPVLGSTTLTIPPHGAAHLICIVDCTDVLFSSK